ncbi:NACHT nucleoside triphosphatase [Penicillium expansum]|nr:NACHT nucleoside triphosphatase [Penicillium expansum]
MGQPTFPAGAFDNRDHGVQNVNVNGKNQYNNNSNGTQYNDCTVHISTNHMSPELEQREDQKKMDDDILRSLAFPEMLSRREGIQRRHGNTCQWILGLEEYKSWMDRSQALLWIKGKPGAGKSTLMEFLYSELKEPQGKDHGIQLEFFFTARGIELQRTPLGMLRSLLNQLFFCDVTVRPLVRAAYQERYEKFGGGERNLEWPQKLLEELLEKAILMSATHQRLTIFVDALDETGEISAQQLADYLDQLNHSASCAQVTLKICFSCRHYPIVDSDLAIEITVEHHNFEDIASYIKDKLPARVRDQEVWQSLGNELIKQANGVFQWVHIVMPAIHQRILRRHSAEDIRKWSRTVPSELEEMYRFILEEVMQIENPQEVFLFFQWLYASEGPLNITEMRYALTTKNATIPSTQPWEQIDGFIKTDEDMEFKIKALSGGLAEIGLYRHDTVIQVVHQTVNEFLRDKGLLRLKSLVDESKSDIDSKEMILQCHATLYQSCLIYLTREVSPRCRGRQGQPFYLKQISSPDWRLPIEKKAQLLSNRPFLYYTTMNLFVHAEKAGCSRTTVNLLSHGETQRCTHSNVLRYEVQTMREFFGQWLNIYMGLRGVWDEHYRPGTTLFHMAAAANMVDIMDILIQNNEELDQTDEEGRSAFHLAARRGHIKVAQMLKESGAECDRKSTRGRTPLEEAAERGHVEFVEWLLYNEPAIDTRSKKAGSALHAASLSGRRDTVNLLIQAGADVNTQGGKYGNALQAAAWVRSTEVVWLLLDVGANVNTQSGEYGNALQAAAWAGSAEVVRLLLDAGADINIRGDRYGSGLQAAASMGRAKVVQMLLEAGADVNAQGGEYGNALQAAAWAESAEVVQLLLNAEADINTQGGRYGNALQAAASGGDAEMVRLLLNAGADVNIQGGEYGSALQAAASGGDAGLVQILLDAGADFNTQDGEYGNALQAAALKRDAEMVRILLNAGKLITAPQKRQPMVMRKRFPQLIFVDR